MTAIIHDPSTISKTDLLGCDTQEPQFNYNIQGLIFQSKDVIQ